MTYRDLIKSSLGENGSKKLPDVLIPEMAIGVAALLANIAYTSCITSPGYSVNGEEFPKKDVPDLSDVMTVLAGDDLLRRTTIYLWLKEFLEWLLNREPEEDEVIGSYEALSKQWNLFAATKKEEDEE